MGGGLNSFHMVQDYNSHRWPYYMGLVHNENPLGLGKVTSGEEISPNPPKSERPGDTLADELFNLPFKTVMVL